MQFAQEIINNPEMRSRLEKTFNSLRSHLTSTKFKTILLVCFTSFTSLLIRETLLVQHSCNPMIHWSGTLPAECQVAIVKTDSRNLERHKEIHKQKPQIPRQAEVYKTSNTDRNPESSKPNPIEQFARQIQIVIPNLRNLIQ